MLKWPSEQWVYRLVFSMTTWLLKCEWLASLQGCVGGAKLELCYSAAPTSLEWFPPHQVNFLFEIFKP